MAVTVTHIAVDASRVSDWQMRIKLLPEVLDLLRRIAGPNIDDRFITDPAYADPSVEPWGWYINWDTPDEKIGFWFKDVRHAVYFKTLWGGV